MKDREESFLAKMVQAIYEVKREIDLSTKQFLTPISHH